MSGNIDRNSHPSTLSQDLNERNIDDGFDLVDLETTGDDNGRRFSMGWRKSSVMTKQSSWKESISRALCCFRKKIHEEERKSEEIC